MRVSFNGLMEEVASFTCAKDLTDGQLVKMVGSGAVGKCSEGDKFHGICRVAEGDCASVQLAGYVRLPYTGTPPTVGDGMVTSNSNADGVEFIQSDGRSVLVLDVDTTNNIVGFIM